MRNKREKRGAVLKGKATDAVLVIDNYDSFTYNLVQYLGELGETVEVRRNNRVTVDEIENRSLRPERIVISPGPGTPDDAGITLEVIERFAGKIPLLGVCLGHQAIGQAFGGRVIRAPELMHGKASEVSHDGKTIFAGTERSFSGGPLSFADCRKRIAAGMSGNLGVTRQTTSSWVCVIVN